MGAGNFLPRRREGIEYELYYLDDDEFYYEPEDGGEREFDDLMRQDAIDQIVAAVQERYPSFRNVKRWDRDELVLLENDIAELRIADNQWSTAIFVIGREDSEHLNLHSRFVCFAGAFLKAVLLENYNGSVYGRKCAWTCIKLVA